MTEPTRFAWHYNHWELLSPLFRPIETRRKEIWKKKPLWEQELRDRLLKEVKGQLPPEVVRTGEAYQKARQEAYWGAWEAYEKAEGALYKALEDHKEEIEALHTIECPDCPWDGETIFTRKDKNRVWY